MSWKPIRNLADFQGSITTGVTMESIYVDFKREINLQKPKAAHELCLDITQFANAAGGTLIIGVDEQALANDGRRVAGAIYPIADFETLRGWTEQQIVNRIVPAEIQREIEAIQLPEGTIMVINIFPQASPAWVYDRSTSTIQCVIRTDHGKQYLSPSEIERLSMNTSRSMKIILDSQSPRTDEKVEIRSEFKRESRIANAEYDMLSEVTFTSVHDTHFRCTVSLPAVAGGPPTLDMDIPYAMLASAWRAGNTLNIVLKCRLIISKYNRYQFELPG